MIDFVYPFELMDRPTQEASENFLFHLYRGTELLGDNRVKEAQEEIERAHALNPSDVKVRDLLAALYFRMGAFDRSVAIYHALAHELPNEPNLHLNLGLARFRAGDLPAARASFARVLELDPMNRRAEGYLGVTLERLGEEALAREAFARSGQVDLIDRVGKGATPVDVTQPPPWDARGRPSIRAIEEAAVGLDVAEPFEGRHVPLSADRLTPLEPVEQGQEARTVVRAPSLPPTSRGGITLDRLANGRKGARLPTMRSFTIAVTEGEQSVSFAVRSEAMRAFSGSIRTKTLDRRYRTSASVELLGGAGGRMLQVEGDGEVILAPRHAHELLFLELHDESVFLREESLVAFQTSLPYLSGKLSRAEDDPLFLVQLRGQGDVLLELKSGVLGIRVTDQRSISVLADDLLGWTDRLVPQLVEPGDAPGGQRGLVSLAGTGTVFIAGQGA